MKLAKTLLIASAFLFAGTASATFTPTYYGDTDSATDLIAGTASGSTDWGYYIWNETASPQTWNVRWTGLGLTEQYPEWFGKIQFQESTLDPSFDASNGGANEYQLEFSGTYADSVDGHLDVSFLGGDDIINWTAFTNNTGGIDGFSFTLTDFVEVLEFELGGSMFSNMSGTDVAGSHIFIGDGLVTPNVTFTDFNGGVAQQFEIKVPAPGALGLMGLSILGLALVRRQKNK
ncbi:PEP-CTERM sorting domain-containing protein [Alteromonas sp. W364]|uniref:PEP-CTERM sorting domain-containing protein n=1 Tax=Alteromonas sp. W364 TaxID=3075610 RepID=UPI002886965D|nr:PEP-CTERM sorting domain-containing protein [Alteromonas sp. W364]MDT0627702.1 PEP-CTERM sorting domain-containing protein [Alteromonas sp. W364]